tara:strand:+ start:88 stop:459 length:372 start_codon:yes stop_codon:yes gene_type:complete
MPITQGAVADALATFLLTDLEADSTAEDNATGNSSGNFFCVYANNTANQVATYVKIADNSNATSNQTIPDYVFYFPGGKALSYTVATGTAYASGLSFWATSTAASNTAQTNPATKTTVRILAT